MKENIYIENIESDIMETHKENPDKAISFINQLKNRLEKIEKKITPNQVYTIEFSDIGNGENLLKIVNETFDEVYSVKFPIHTSTTKLYDNMAELLIFLGFEVDNSKMLAVKK